MLSADFSQSVSNRIDAEIDKTLLIEEQRYKRVKAVEDSSVERDRNH